MVSSGPGGLGTKHISKNYPNIRGIIAGTTKQEGTSGKLRIPKSLIKKNELIGL